MSAPSRAKTLIARGALAIGGLAVGTLAYAGLYEVDAYRLRRVTVPILPEGAGPIRILQVSDLHMTPWNRARQTWVSRLAALEPDLVVDTGDNLADLDAVPFVLSSLGRLLDVPGVFVWGSNDYFGPTFKNPLRYLTPRNPTLEPKQHKLPWEDLGRAFSEHGWIDLTHERAVLELRGVRFGFRGVDDAHLEYDNYSEVAGPIERDLVDVAIGVTHAPYLRVLDRMTEDGHDLIVAGHTHGGQVRVPGLGALVTNCDLDPSRARGLSTHTAAGRTAWLHVSAGLGTSPFAPIRFACPPEATLLTLTARS